MHLLLAIGAGLLVYILLMRMFHKTIQEEEALSRRLHEIEKKSGKGYQSQREEILDQPFFDRVIRPMLESAGSVLKKIPAYFGRTNDSELKLQTQLNQAGSTMKVTEYTALRVGLTLVTAVLGLFLAVVSNVPMLNKMLYVLLGVFGPYIVMRYTLAGKVARRKQLIEQQLPEVLDLMSVSVEAGLGFEQAIDYIIENMEGDLIDELSITAREIAMGRSRRNAFLLLGERCGADSVRSFVSALVQAIDMGISMRVLLSSQADSMRLHRKRVVEEKAMKISTKMLLPLVFFIFPVMFIILLGPAFMNILQAF